MNSTNIYLPFNNGDTGIRRKKMDTSIGQCNRCRKKKWGKEEGPKCLKKQHKFRKMTFGVEHGRDNR